MRIFAFMTGISVMLLSGCVSLRVPTADQTHFAVQSPTSRQLALSKLQQWQMNGALSIAPSSGHAEIANYVWQQNGPKHYRITLTSAFDFYRLVIEKQQDEITLLKNGRLITQAKTPEALMHRAVGWSLPIEALQYWIKGVPAPGFFVAKYDQYGHVMTLKQTGWVVHYRQYQTTLLGVDFPQMMVMQRPKILAKIVITQVLFTRK